VNLRTTDIFATDSAVGREIQKGYGLLILGIAKTEAPQGGFHEEIARVAAMYEGPFAVVIARGLNAERAREMALNILAPVRGNKVSRRAAEVALAIAKMSNSPMTALYVLGTVGLGAAQRRLRRPTTTHHYEEAVLNSRVPSFPLRDRGHGCSLAAVDGRIWDEIVSENRCFSL